MTRETKAEFLARYPVPTANQKRWREQRVLVRCECGDDICTGWGWGWKGDLMPWETEVDESD